MPTTDWARFGRQELEARALSAPARPCHRGPDHRDATRPSALGAADDPRQAAQGVRRGAFTLWHLPLPGAPPSHRAQGPSPPAQRLQTLGTIPLDGALADGRGGPDLSF